MNKPATVAERQAALRQRRLEQGMTEVRGIYLPTALHAELKRMARALQKRGNDGPATRMNA